MWVRSQNKLHLVNTDDISLINKNIYAENILLGEYSSNEKAMEVLDKIQKYIVNRELLKNAEEGGYWAVYEMPQNELKAEVL
ncbi:hypothetical protein LGL08_20735 [Clostridium estertheticum]|uniref:hypothetical protein n=1 Tax=Clostridium estertheticum TaxID=238834 RepID=UPI001CF50017|nr:hypothetical protein [Clostridium estertheticum]MCB2308865.1 hypothetical protein [Clostridium estertheticum]MCB2347277.1 hypothetical protein [Clostridium estertheticum]MCB2351956.1 hypothetical protein [Clostridium estertheticum]WAG48480.1 hypothetical protein LL127_23445 [Clostridium estertheticum]